MTGRALGIVAPVALAASVVAQRGQPTPQQRTTFRITTAVVAVDVAVRRGNVPVAGLTAADFNLLDNGVPQRIDSVSVEAVPIDVSLIVDTSGSVVSNFEEFKDDVKRFARMLRPVDQVRVVSFGTGVQEIIPMQSATVSLKLEALQPGGATSSNDGLFYGLLWPTEVDRRHLVIAMTDGVDTFSTLSSASIVEVAERTSAVFHVILVSGYDPTTTWERGSRQAVAEAAVRTGGEVHKLGRAGNDFKSIFEDFRASYVLRYTPEGVARDGWHDLKVSVRAANASKLTIRSRRGYWGDTR
jgi:hypothetical protein